MKKKGKIFRLAGKCIIKNAVIKWAGFCLFSLQLLRLWDTLFLTFQTFFQAGLFNFRWLKKLGY